MKERQYNEASLLRFIIGIKFMVKLPESLAPSHIP